MPLLALPQRFLPRLLAALFALIVVYGLQSLWTRSLVRPNVVDFRVIYCGERAVVRERADPYRVEPLRTCEHRVRLEAGEPVWSVTPFPLPGYAAAALSPLAFLPYQLARSVWIALLAVSFALAAVAIAGILEVSTFAVGLVFAPTLGILNVHYGEPVLISVAAFCLAALAVHAKRPKLAALAAAVSMIEPHVGLPAALGVFVFLPEARRTLAALAAVLAALSVATLGLGTNVEYLRGFLPAQAHAELIADDQFSLSHLLYVFGAAPQTALLLGSLSYGVTTLAGLWVARVLVNRSLPRALYVLVPVAMAMLGGPFIHDVQVAAALPAAVVLGRRYWTARIAVALLALDWAQSVTHLVMPALVAAAGMSVIVLHGARPVRRALYALAVTVGVLALALVLPLQAPPLDTYARQPAPRIAASELSSIPWGLRIKATPDWSEDTIRPVLIKLPMWLGLLLMPLSLLAYRTRDARGFSTHYAAQALD